jgi:flagellar hook-associated protein 3 FlgL
MRVTNSMITGQVIYNLQRSLSRFMKLETDLSSGRRINRPSDDAVGTVRDLRYRRELARATQFKENISTSLSLSGRYDTILSDIKEGLDQARNVAVSMSDDAYDEVAREGSAVQIEGVLDRLIGLANSQHGGNYIFSGYKTDQKALLSSAMGVTFEGDTGRIDIPIETDSRLTSNLIGSEVFLKQLSLLGSGSDVNVGINLSTNLADLQLGNGIDQATGTFTITDENLGITATVDISAAVTVDDTITAINNALTAAGITNLTASLGLENNNILLDSTENGLITDGTSLSRINQGNGVDLTDGRLRITDAGTVDFLVDLSGATTVGEVRAMFDAQMVANGINNVTMTINASQTSFQITDTNGPPDLGLTISNEAAGMEAASGLGIAGYVGASMIGSDLAPVVAFSVAELTGSTAADLGLEGTFTGDFAGNDLDAILLDTSLLADFKSGLGADFGRLVVTQGNRSQIIDLSDPTIITVQDMLDAFNNSGLDITASINDTGRGIQIVNNDASMSLVVQDDDESGTAKSLGVFGSSDIMGSLMALVDCLHKNDADGAGRLIENMDQAIDSMLNTRSEVGSRVIRMESTYSRLTSLQLSVTGLLSEVEDADLTKVATDLATQESVYRAALIASSRLIQPTLLDFLK